MVGAYGALFWVIVAALLFAAEGVTVQLVGIWFAVGALITIFPSALGAPLWVQLLVFLLASILFLLFIRPVVKTRIAVKKQPTNADMAIGKPGLVLEEIDNIREAGRVSAMGLTWTARSLNGDVIPEDAQIIVERIDGVKLIVSPMR